MYKNLVILLINQFFEFATTSISKVLQVVLEIVTFIDVVDKKKNYLFVEIDH